MRKFVELSFVGIMKEKREREKSYHKTALIKRREVRRTFQTRCYLSKVSNNPVAGALSQNHSELTKILLK